MTRFWSVGYASATLVLAEWLVIKPAPQLDQQINGFVVIVLKWAIMAANVLVYVLTYLHAYPVMCIFSLKFVLLGISVMKVVEF